MGDTVVALATAPLPAGVAVVRISGPQAFEVAKMMMPAVLQAAPRELVWGRVVDGEVALDEGLAVRFEGPASFTGEDVVEFHTHGGRAVVQAVLDAVLAFEGVRMALPGEFTRRAVLNGKMDLTAAEGLADLVAAETDIQRRQALRQLDGALGERFEGWRTAVLNVLAQVEAAIDFPDEELDVLGDPALSEKIRDVLKDLQQAVGEQAGVRVREGITLAIVGRPNAGKSTLLNLLSGREVAIVSPLAGTTRDVVTSVLDIGGFPVTLADTAGLRLTDDVIEAEGVRRARMQAERADILVAVVDGEEGGEIPEDVAELLVPGRSLVVVSKADLVDDEFANSVEIEGEKYPLVAANLTDRAALGRVSAALGKLVKAVAGGASEAALLTRERHRAAVEDAIGGLGNALIMIGKASGEGTVAELVAQDLREAAAAIGTVTGRTSSEDVLDVVFSTFCVGK
ncbi:MAG: tRNA uridine-5-carboxymethylaminomethyl(34) synthesis GTPase MnmE [Proteobacteria bacterium]|nr:tRNA uridine-5-carboxymethylaminomethyl(34) synthesis GTPase MnmE [Pseudomonadota bacterium]